jgi:hypothetical protein
VAGLLAEPMKIVQARKETMILYEVDNLHRQVFTDGRGFPATFEFPADLGYSSIRILYDLVPDNDIFEMFCRQNEKDRSHLVK